MLQLYSALLWPRVRPDWKEDEEMVCILPHSSTLLHGRVLLKFMCDCDSSVEVDRLNLISNNKYKLRSEKYFNLAPHRVASGGVNGAPAPPPPGQAFIDPESGVRGGDKLDALDNGIESPAGQCVRLPSSYTGGPRYMAQLCKII